MSNIEQIGGSAPRRKPSSRIISVQIIINNYVWNRGGQRLINHRHGWEQHQKITTRHKFPLVSKTFLKSCQADGILVSFSQFIQRLRMSLVRYMLAVWGSILILRQKNSCKIIYVIFICGWRGASSIIFMGHCEQWHI